MIMNQTFSRLCRWAAGSAIAILALAVARPIVAQDVYTSGHGDIGVGFDVDEMQFEPHWHIPAGSIINGVPLVPPDDEEYEEFEPDGLIARTSATRTTTSGGMSELLGIGEDTPVWVLGSSPYQPNLGFGAEELTQANWNGPITVTFNPGPGFSTMPSGTAVFGMYTTLSNNFQTAVFSSSNASLTFANNSFEINPGDHEHFQWAFTELGDYVLNFTWSGNHTVYGDITTSATFTFQAVPEPSTVAMLGIAGGAGLIALVRRITFSSMRTNEKGSPKLLAGRSG